MFQMYVQFQVAVKIIDKNILWVQYLHFITEIVDVKVVVCLIRHEFP